MGTIYFNYRGKKYTIYFLPCGNVARIERNGFFCECRFDKSTSLKALWHTIDYWELLKMFN